MKCLNKQRWPTDCSLSIQTKCLSVAQGPLVRRHGLTLGNDVVFFSWFMVPTISAAHQRASLSCWPVVLPLGSRANLHHYTSYWLMALVGAEPVSQATYVAGRWYYPLGRRANLHHYISYWLITLVGDEPISRVRFVAGWWYYPLGRRANLHHYISYWLITLMGAEPISRVRYVAG